MTKIVKTFINTSPDDIKSSGERTFISFDKLKGYLEIAAGLRGDEIIEGIVVDEDGIDIKIGKVKT